MERVGVFRCGEGGLGVEGGSDENGWIYNEQNWASVF